MCRNPQCIRKAIGIRHHDTHLHQHLPVSLKISDRGKARLYGYSLIPNLIIDVEKRTDKSNRLRGSSFNPYTSGKNNSCFCWVLARDIVLPLEERTVSVQEIACPLIFVYEVGKHGAKLGKHEGLPCSALNLNSIIRPNRLISGLRKHK